MSMGSKESRPRYVRGSTALVMIAAGLGLLGSSAHAAQPGQAPEVVAVHIVSRVNRPGTIADARAKRARADVGVTLYAVLEVAHGDTPVFFSDAPVVRLRGRLHTTRAMDQAPPALLLWYKVEPATEDMSNTISGSFRFEAIDYREVLMRSWLFRAGGPADVRPTLTPDRGRGVGTMRYKLRALTTTGALSTPGRDARRGPGSGGLDDGVHRVSLRRDDTYLGVMTEMYGQPYIWASAGRNPETHQSERLEGADCADLMVYGARRKGYRIPYTWTGGLHRYTRTLARGTPDMNGVYVDARGQPIPFTRPGDLLLFPRHVGALARDRGVKGVLDTADVMMHTLFASPREQPISETSYAGVAVTVLRWNKAVAR